MSRRIRLALSTLLLAALTGFISAGCASKDPDDFERDDYFGGMGATHNQKHFVPRQVQRY